MSQPETLSSFFRENSRIAREWLDAKVEVYRLRLIRVIAKASGYLIWTLISLFIGFLFLIFIGVTTGFWLSSITGSYTTGFGIVTIALVLLLLILALFRRKIFIDPIIRMLIKKSVEEKDDEQPLN